MEFKYHGIDAVVEIRLAARLTSHRHLRSPLLSALLLAVLLALVIAPTSVQSRAATTGDFWAFESGQVRPLALSPDHHWLYAVNTPDNRLEVFDVSTGGLIHRGSTPVGLEPVAVAASDNGQVWVVNHLSDSVTVLDATTTPPRVVRTLWVGDEPRDIVFAGVKKSRAFITTAHRGQNSRFGRGDFDKPGVGRADVWVFDANKPGSQHAGTPLSVITLFGDKPRALAVSPDGKRVYASVFRSGNRTTTIHPSLVCPHKERDGCLSPEGLPVPGYLPKPWANFEGIPAPPAGLIVKFDPEASEWRDELDRDWSSLVKFTLPDLDVFEIDAEKLTELRSFSGVGTVLFNMAVNPKTGVLYVSNTDAKNEVRFEGPGTLSTRFKSKGVPLTVRGHLHETRITVIDAGSVTPRHLNPHIDYKSNPSPAVKEQSLAIPLNIAITSDGKTLYVSAFGSRKIGIIDTAALESGAFVPSSDDHIELGSGPVEGGGPTGIVLDEPRKRLYVMTRFDNSIVAVDLAKRVVVERASLFNPEPKSLVAGRPFFYDARLTSSNGEAACASCHIFGDMDDLAWDLGNPDGRQARNPNTRVPVDENLELGAFHPMKGPMATQSMRGLANHGPMHWRGDRTGGNNSPPGDPHDERLAFEAFQVAFGGLLGRMEGPLPAAQMSAFTDFALQLRYPPNPIRQLDNSMRADERAGEKVFRREKVFKSKNACIECHVLDRAKGFFGTAGLNSPLRALKVPHLRNAYQKVGMFGFPKHPFIAERSHAHTGPQVRGFGFTHDATIDTLLRFFSQVTFTLNEEDRHALQAFVLAFESNLAPIVGQQVTISSNSGAAAIDRLDLLLARADAPFVVMGLPDARECELVVKGRVGGDERGWLHEGSGRFRSDRAADPLLDTAALRGSLTAPGDTLTFTCAPPGSGRRIAIDRDRDGILDGDDRDVHGAG